MRSVREVTEPPHRPVVPRPRSFLKQDDDPALLTAALFTAAGRRGDLGAHRQATGRSSQYTAETRHPSAFCSPTDEPGAFRHPGTKPVRRRHKHVWSHLHGASENGKQNRGPQTRRAADGCGGRKPCSGGHGGGKGASCTGDHKWPRDGPGQRCGARAQGCTFRVAARSPREGCAGSPRPRPVTPAGLRGGTFSGRPL